MFAGVYISTIPFKCSGLHAGQLCFNVIVMYAMCPSDEGQSTQEQSCPGVIEVADILRLLKTKANRQHHVPKSCRVHV